jgi:hypothetical protein
MTSYNLKSPSLVDVPSFPRRSSVHIMSCLASCKHTVTLSTANRRIGFLLDCLKLQERQTTQTTWRAQDSEDVMNCKTRLSTRLLINLNKTLTVFRTTCENPRNYLKTYRSCWMDDCSKNTSLWQKQRDLHRRQNSLATGKHLTFAAMIIILQHSIIYRSNVFV